ncbi:MAG: hypothetical protein HYW49_01875 [Deltaproteobacteria bacterium]|nr:hypothetical protein [Deltaproteobacteria bacterium]
MNGGTYARILETLYGAIDRVNPQLEKSRRLQKAENTPLLGDGSNLDSMGLISFTVEVEQAMLDKFEKTVNLAEILAESDNPAESPLRSVGSLAEYLRTRIEMT